MLLGAQTCRHAMYAGTQKRRQTLCLETQSRRVLYAEAQKCRPQARNVRRRAIYADTQY